MKTDVYKFQNTVADLDTVTEAAAKIAAYNGLAKKQELKLALLCEELVEMLPNLLMYGAGKFWIENEDTTYRIHALVEADTLLSSTDREGILSVSSTGRNAAAVGIVNKIRLAAEVMLAEYARAEGTACMTYPDAVSASYTMGIHADPIGYTNQWTLSDYKEAAKNDSEEAWDELEKSVIANLADEVTVGIIKGKVEITIIKKF